MNLRGLTSRRIVAGIALSVLAATIFVLVRSIMFAPEATSLTHRDLLPTQTNPSVAQHTLRPSQFQLANEGVNEEQPSNKLLEQSKLETRLEASSATSIENNSPQALPRAGLALKVRPQLRKNQSQDGQQRTSERDQQIADSAKLSGYHLEQRNRMIVPRASNTNVPDTPERAVPKAQGNRLPTASYTPPQS